ncbi:carbohydrate ABC transporter permease [Natronosalvus rutilus]|uniref:Sugar ABC transporter permease n=1 Tax=Natronosalvus rutilus TaxID=2953753 RepID=A0A9E7SSL0_9EURY|nr:sugar ABC transporter permease [Natronosalvus rutilus]UTF52659.1 sugar ABC transporter permease [Natronosalvus rutilus]
MADSTTGEQNMTRLGEEGVRGRLERYRELRITEEELAVALLTPVMLFLLAVSFYPIVDTVWASLHTGYVIQLPTKPTEFVGIENYQRLFSDGSFWNALGVSLFYTFVSVPIELVFGLGLALLLKADFKGKYFAQAAILFPWALPTVINAKIWAWLLNPNYGVISDILVRVGILSAPYPFLSKPDAALYAMTSITIWKTTSFMALIMLAGLSSIPDHLYESARMDGASRWRQFRDITLPLLKPTILVALIFRTLPAFQAFGLPYGLTGGGPGEATTTLVLYTQQAAYNNPGPTNGGFALGSAAATVITMIALVIALIYVATLYEPEVR